MADKKRGRPGVKRTVAGVTFNTTYEYVRSLYSDPSHKAYSPYLLQLEGIYKLLLNVPLNLRTPVKREAERLNSLLPNVQIYTNEHPKNSTFNVLRSVK